MLSGTSIQKSNVPYTGIVTTTATMYTLLDKLLHHSEVQDKLYEEMETNIGSHRTVTLNDKDQLPCCHPRGPSLHQCSVPWNSTWYHGGYHCRGFQGHNSECLESYYIPYERVLLHQGCANFWAHSNQSCTH